MRAAAKQSKQKTLENLPSESQRKSAKTAETEQKKRIVITEIGSETKEDELALKVGFSLFPSKAAFSKIRSDLFFDGQKLNCTCISILPGPLAADNFELTPVLDMRGIPAGPHTIRVEMYELWSTGERLCEAAKEVTVDYVSVTREEKLVRVPIVKRVAGADLAIVSDSEKGIYREIEESMKKELISKRDEW